MPVEYVGIMYASYCVLFGTKPSEHSGITHCVLICTDPAVADEQQLVLEFDADGLKINRSHHFLSRPRLVH